METRNNGPVLFKTTPLVHWNWKQVPFAMDDKDGNGLLIVRYVINTFPVVRCIVGSPKSHIGL